jgi:ATP-binding cassette subfamily B protein
MNGSVREIVSFAKPEEKLNEEKLWKALQIACADGFVSESEQCIDTVLGERGSGISEGQMQRLAIARAVFSDAPVLLLDEATSALDVDTEKRLLYNLRELTDKTVITVTHRPAVLSICDRVLEFTEDGITEKKPE